MKHTLLFFTLAAAVAAVSCSKPAELISRQEASAPGEIVIGVGEDFSAEVSTKATAITSVPSTLYWGATTGTSSESSKWAATSASVSSSKINTGHYQTASPTAYNYYVANQSFSVGATTSMTVANNNTDVIAGRTASSSSLTPSVTLGHIFARTGTLTANAPSGYTISGVSWKIVGKSDINGTAGTYNMTSGAWSAASTKLSSETSLTSSSDMYLIPGTYTIKVTYTLSKGEWSSTATKSADVTLVQGKINNITGTVNNLGGASEIVLSLSVSEWTTNNISGISFN